MTLPMSRADDAPVAAMPSATSAASSSSESASGQVAAQDLDLGGLLVSQILTTGALEGDHGFAPGLHLAGQDAQHLVVGQGVALLLLDVVGGTRRHPQDIATQRIAAPHGGGDVGLDLLLKGHRIWHLG